MVKENRRNFLKKIGLSSILGVVSINKVISQETNNQQEIIDSPIKPGVYHKDKTIIHVTDEMVHVAEKGMDYYAYKEGVEFLSLGKGVKIIFRDLLNYSNTSGLQGGIDGVVDEIEIICETSSESIKLKREKLDNHELFYMDSKGSVKTESIGESYVGWFGVGGNLLKETREQFKQYIPFEKVLSKKGLITEIPEIKKEDYGKGRKAR